MHEALGLWVETGCEDDEHSRADAVTGCRAGAVRAQADHFHAAPPPPPGPPLSTVPNASWSLTIKPKVGWHVRGGRVFCSWAWKGTVRD